MAGVDRLLRVGIIGTGSIADDMHAPALKLASNACLWSVLSRDIDRSRLFAKKHTAKAPSPAHDDLGLFLGDPNLDAVIVASPDRLHYHHAHSSLKAGKHVLVEKPLATSVHEAEDLVRTAAISKLLLGVGFHLRWHAGIRKAVELVRTGRIGALRHVSMQWTFYQPTNTNWRAHDQLGRWWSLAGTGAHCIDLARWIASEVDCTFEAITGVTTCDTWGGPHDESACVVIKFNKSMTAQCISSVLFPSESFLNIYGTDGSIRCTGVLARATPGKIYVSDEELSVATNNPFVDQIEAFSVSIRQGYGYPVSGEDGLTNVKDLCHIS